MPGAILSLNAGSSSFKCAVHQGGQGIWRGEVGDLASRPSLHLTARDGAVVLDQRLDGGGLAAALDALLTFVEARTPLAAVGHRVVHGGERFAEPIRVEAPVVEALEGLIPLAPLHQPAALAPMRRLLAVRPALPQVACFDTAFHRTLAPEAATYALPADLEAQGLRRYGFHGLSYEFIGGQLQERWPDLARGRVVVAHLGGGCSLCALRGGLSEDTTMGFTPLDGVPMQTRSGAVDPGLLLYLLRARGMTPDALEDLLERRSGLVGLSGTSGDVRALEASADPRARFALAVFARRVRGAIGALTANLGGLDALVFTGGIGAHAAGVRASICAGLDHLGIELEAAANREPAPQISVPGAHVTVLKLVTDEEAVIAGHTARLLEL